MILLSLMTIFIFTILSFLSFTLSCTFFVLFRRCYIKPWCHANTIAFCQRSPTFATWNRPCCNCWKTFTAAICEHLVSMSSYAQTIRSSMRPLTVGKDCSMEQMTEIREQQERLARLHFELGQRQEVGGEQSGLRQSSANMRHLLHRLQQLSVCIEKLHSK